MARKRMIDPNIWWSEDVRELSIFERLLLIGMFSNADDEGKGRANPSGLRSMICPYDDIPVDDFEKAIKNIEKHICIKIYSIEGSKYYKFLRWKKWQKVDKPQKSIIPEPFDEESPNDSTNSNRMSSDEEKRKKEKRIEENIKEEKLREENSNSSNLSLELSKHIEKVTCGKWFLAKDIDKINILIDMHGYDLVKDALNEATKRCKYDCDYAEGILNNWAKKGRRESSGSTGKDVESCTYDFTDIGDNY